MNHPVYAADSPVSLRVFTDDVFFKSPWRSPFSPIASDEATVSIGIETPNPILEVKLNEAYGERQSKVEHAGRWFSTISKRILETSNVELVNVARKNLLLWAEKDALSSGIHVSWGSKPVDWQVMTLIGSILTTTAVVGESFQVDERVKVGHWLNRLMWNVAQSRWAHRIDNKALMRSYYVMLWGLMIGDYQAVQSSVDHFKKTIHDIRPDGSFPIDTQRSGMGLKYNADAAGFMVMMAVLAEFGTSKNLHLYSVEGRSLATVVEFVVQSMMKPIEMNQRYAISCPSSGDRWGSVSKPSTGFIGNSAFLRAYLLLDPNNPQAGFIKRKYRWDIVQSETFSVLSDKIFSVRERP
ncbi:MAG: alginate lyase family protein [Burkholderiaceae bacterium]|nr:alginate lyase family protein [Burkholderiaceae bacterium]